MAKALPFILAAVEVGVSFLPGVGPALALSLRISAGVGALTAAANILTSPGVTKPEAAENTIKSPLAPRIDAFGTSRIYLTEACFETASDGTTVDVGAICEGPADAILYRYLNDTRVTLSGSVVQALADKSYQGGNVRMGETLGPTPNVAFAEVVAKIPDRWTSAHRGDGVVTGYLLKNPEKDKYYLETYPQGDSVQPSWVGRWKRVFDWRDPGESHEDPSTWKWSDNPVLCLVWYLMVRRGYDWDRFTAHLDKLTAAADDCDVAMPLSGVTILSAAVAAGDTTMLVTNPGLLTVGGTATVGNDTVTVSKIDGATVTLVHGIGHAHPAGTTVTSGTALTEPRYRTCLSYKLTDLPSNIIGSFLACFDGWYDVGEAGEVIIYSGRHYQPTVHLGPDLIAAYSIAYAVPVEDAINEVTVQYVSDQHDYKQVDAQSWRDEDAIAASGREPNTADLGAMIPSFTQGRRLAKRKMARTNAAPITITTTLAGDIVIGERFISIDLKEAGATFYSGPVEITTAPERNLQTGGVTFTCVPVDPNIDAWNPATEDGEGAPVGNRVAPEPLPTPTIASVTPTYGQASGYDTPGVKLTIVASGPAMDGLVWYVRTRPTGSTSWLEQEYADEDPGPSVTLVTDFLPFAKLDVEVSYGAADGRISDWGTTDTVDTASQLPGAVANLSVTAAADGSLIVADWDDTRFATSYRVEIIVEPS